MITPDYCRLLADYNAWQNSAVRRAVAGLDHPALLLDRQAFFGSILGTLNHLLWADRLWMSRFDGGDRPPGGIRESAGLTTDAAAWEAGRVETDARITRWTADLSADALAGDLTWFSGAARREVTRPLALCVVHFFNHQTHHRGQVHALLTDAGARPEDTDLFLMPGAEPA
jgi:uncharacterized damage-inducible protein DinB